MYKIFSKIISYFKTLNMCFNVINYVKCVKHVGIFNFSLCEIKELSLCHKLKFYYLYIFAT